jgi:anti-sigma B factor antagonist
MTARVVGELDILTALQLTAVLDQIDGNSPGRLLLDLDAVEFLDSTGLAAILLAESTAEQHGYEFTVRYSSPQVVRVFELTGMTGRFRRE